MASQAEILNLLAGESSPLHRQHIAEKLGEKSYRSFQTQLDRLTRRGLLEATDNFEYSITEAGKMKLAEESAVTSEISEEKLGTTEYQQFIRLGKMTGVSPPALIKQTADHVWNGGDYRDLEWVARAFQEMGVRQDLRQRWWHSWRSYLHQPIPAELPSAISESVDEKKGKKEGKSKRSYILDADDKPVYVGEGLGDLEYEDALELAKVRAGRRQVASSGQPQSAGSLADELTKVMAAFREMMGEKAEGKSYVVRPTEEGYQIEEAEPGRPVIVSQPPANQKTPTYFVNQNGEVQEIQPGQPIIIKQPAPQPSGGVQYLIDKNTGKVEQVQPGQPIIIQAQPQPYTPIQMTDKDGNPIVLDLSTYIRLEEFKDKRRRDEESHETKQEIAKSFKDLISKATSALGHMAEEK